MNAVIPYRHERDHGEELRYAIRSLVKYFAPLKDVILVGDAPDWYNGLYEPLDDVKGRKEYGIYRKLIRGAATRTVLYYNDDYYALKPFDETLPNYYKGTTCKQARPIDANYRRLYEACPGDWLDYEVHVPMIIDTALLVWPEKDVPIKTYYANHNKLPGTVLPDCKLRGVLGYWDIKARIQGRPFFSTNGNIKAGDMLQVMNELYPEKSKYEI